MRTLLRFSCLLLLLPLLSMAQSNNAGFVQGLWYDRDVLFADEPVRIYAAVRNNTGGEMSGTVTFYIDDEILTRKSVTALDGRIVESWADWISSYGEHSVRAELSRLEISRVDGKEERITVTAPLAEDILFIDYDTDGDGIGNKEDADDDGDGVSDKAEADAGTDPLIPDQPTADDDAAADQAAEREREDSALQLNSASTSSPAAGLEQFLTPSRVETLLSSITDLTNDTRIRLDSYRKERAYQTAVTNNDPGVTVNEDGFGDVVRDLDVRNTAEKPEGFFGDLMTLIGTIISGLVTAGLAVLSYILFYPMLIQLLLLFTLLYLIYRLARKFGSRPS